MGENEYVTYDSPAFTRVLDRAEFAAIECGHLMNIVDEHNVQLSECRNSIQDLVAYCNDKVDAEAVRIDNITQTFTVDLAKAIVELVKKHYCFDTTPEHDAQFYQELEQLYTFN